MDDRGKPDRSETLAAFGVNAGIVDEIRRRYEIDPSSVDASWASQFGGHARSELPGADEASDTSTPTGEEIDPSMGDRLADRHARVLRLIHAYRSRGHRIADTDPLGQHSSYFSELDPAHYGFGTEELDQLFIAGNLPGGPVQTLR
jgi:2-oxoglutarate dehydrogenase E1 component